MHISNILVGMLLGFIEYEKIEIRQGGESAICIKILTTQNVIKKKMST